jgi:hypothetical protein
LLLSGWIPVGVRSWIRSGFGIVGLASADERVRAQDGGASLYRSRGARQPVKDVAWLVDQVLADDMDGAAIDEVPRVDQVMAADVQLEQLAPTLGSGLPCPRLPVHDADCAHPCGMVCALQHSLDLGGRHRQVLLRQCEDLAHADAGVKLGLAAASGSEGGQPAEEVLCGWARRSRHRGLSARHTLLVHAGAGKLAILT